MVGIVVVSHSKKVAEGVVELAAQMAGANDHIIPCGGMEDGSIGTDAVRIMEAISDANTGDGVAILVDLGSGILSTQTALDLLEEPIDARIADAPILEGAVAAAAEAGQGTSLDAVIGAAEEARTFSKNL
ncbi:MAG: PTS-dependent dihydroxyacetone kinase phosphotransferase subunit DhaM [Lachnospiraceae bacterium]|nr:PTS-dependent dihydroxyacetone kinase phosphotransferase subunit DhaM [Lachnospiraceae bacterium]